jgi:hypothetical protein
MNFRVVMVAIVTAAGAAAAVAQPDKDEQPVTPRTPAAPSVVLASANEVRRPSPTNSEGPATTARRVTPRVTTCRCGDPQPEELQKPEE